MASVQASPSIRLHCSFRVLPFIPCTSALHADVCDAAVWLLEEEEEIKGGHAPVGGQVHFAGWRDGRPN